MVIIIINFVVSFPQCDELKMSIAEDHDTLGFGDSSSMESLLCDEAGASSSTAVVNLTRYPPEQWSVNARQAAGFRIPVVDRWGEHRLGEYNFLVFHGIIS
jgi:hypothetical protein